MVHTVLKIKREEKGKFDVLLSFVELILSFVVHSICF